MSPRQPISLVPAVHRAAHRIALLLEPLGVTQGEAHVLAALHEAGEATIGALHHHLGHRRSTLTSIVDRLEDARLVVRTAHPTDGRSIVVRLTTRGRRGAATVHAVFHRLETAIERAQGRAVG